MNQETKMWHFTYFTNYVKLRAIKLLSTKLFRNVRIV